MTSQNFFGMGGHQSAKPETVEWLTPPPIIAAMGGADSFDLDPATPDIQPYPTARVRYTRADNGLFKPWFGRVWLNPPYTDDEIGKWMARLAEHGRGMALIFARTETEMFFRWVWERASGLLFLRGRLHFHLPDGRRAKRNAGAPSVLCAYGPQDLDVLAGCGLGGQLVPLRMPRGVMVLGVSDRWADVVASVFAGRRGPVAIADLYRALAQHPKARANNHVRAKLRQQLQRGPYRRVARGLWEVVPI